MDYDRERDRAALKAHSGNREAVWHRNDAGEWPGPCEAVRLRDGREFDCMDASEHLIWAKTGSGIDIVEYFGATMS